MANNFVDNLVGLRMGAFPFAFKNVSEPFNFGVVDGCLDLDTVLLGIDVLEIIPVVLPADRAERIFLVWPGKHLGR